MPVIQYSVKFKDHLASYPWKPEQTMTPNAAEFIPSMMIDPAAGWNAESYSAIKQSYVDYSGGISGVEKVNHLFKI
jgi:hypothetical protein